MGAKFKAIDIANFYVQLTNALPDNQMDNMKINKILYYAQGWSLSKLNRPLFSDEIQAWEYGPVVPNVYRTFKCCGKNPIEEPSDSFDESRLSGDELDVLVNVYTNYGRYTGWALKDMTHRPGSPWAQVFVPGKNNVISQESIHAYFDRERLEGFDISSLNIPIVDRIPRSWDSKEDEIYDGI